MVTIQCLTLNQQQYKILMFLIYGLKNCDSCRKALYWMETEKIKYTFLDLRSDSFSMGLVKNWAAGCGWLALLNKRGLTWRKLREERKIDLNEDTAIALMGEFPALIKRPIFIWNRNIIVGFKEEQKNKIVRLCLKGKS